MIEIAIAIEIAVIRPEGEASEEIERGERELRQPAPRRGWPYGPGRAGELVLLRRPSWME